MRKNNNIRFLLYDDAIINVNQITKIEKYAEGQPGAVLYLSDGRYVRIGTDCFNDLIKTLKAYDICNP